MTEIKPATGPMSALEEAGLVLMPLHRWNAVQRIEGRDGAVTTKGLGKRPRDRRWPSIAYDSRVTLAEVAREGVNAGVRLRAIDLVIDWDPRNDDGRYLDTEAFDEFVLWHGLDPTDWPTVETGAGGRHFYLAKPSGRSVVDALADFPGVEFKSIGRQVVAPGSIHPNGTAYRWAGEPIDMFGAPNAPEALLSAIERPARGQQEATEGGVHSPDELEAMLSHLDPEDFRNQERWLELMMACHHATDGAGREEFVAWSIGDPLYADDAPVIGQRWDSLDARRPGGVTHRTLYKRLSEAGAADAVPRRSAAEDFDEVPECENGAGCARPWPRKLTYEVKHGAKNARLFLSQRSGRMLYSDGRLFSLEPTGLWTRTDEDAVRSEIRATDPTDVLDVDHVDKMIRGVKSLVATAAKPFEWVGQPATDASPEDLALFRNGLLDVRTRVLHPHDGAYFATGAPEFDYDPHAEAPTWMRWLDETLHPSFHPTLQEWFGYLLTPDVSAQKMMHLTGRGGSGKSTCQSVMLALVGTQHCHSADLASLGSEFGLEPCQDKRLLNVPDAHDVQARTRGAALERLKAITGGDPVPINRKHIGIVSMRLRSRLTVTSNRMPKFIDESGALAQRLLAVIFERRFRGEPGQRPDMSDTLLRELPGIANWALDGLDRLRANGMRFTVGERGREVVHQAERDQSPAKRFAEARLSVSGDRDDFVSLKDIYAAYQDWVLDEGLGRHEWRSQTDLSADLAAALDGVQRKQRRRDRKQTWGLTGVREVLPATDFD